MMYLNNIRKFANILSSPNNILGIEYLKALKKFKSKIQPIAIARYEVGHNDLNYAQNVASSTAIRNILKNDNINSLSSLMPANSYSTLLQKIKMGHVIPDISVFEKQIIYLLRKMDLAEIAELPDVSEGLEVTIKKAANSCNTIVEFLDIAKSKRYTTTRLQRILVYALLGITKKDIALSKKIHPYVRVLGLNSRGKFLISEIAKANPRLEIITSVKRFYDKNSNKNLKAMLDKDIWATDVYTIGYNGISTNNLDFTNKIITL